MVKNLYIKTFGCQMNEYDSLKLAKILESEYKLVETPEEADLIFINTCSVRDKAEKKVYSLLGSFKRLKKKKKVVIGVGGCVAQQEGENIVKKSPVVDFVVGTHNLSLVPSLIERVQNNFPPQVAVDYRSDWEQLPIGISSGVCGLVSISRGCNKNCSFCIVPKTRGPEVSRPLEEVVREVKYLVAQGSKEIILLGQTVNSWGNDLKPRKKFVDLLEAVCTVEGVKRVRFTSPHPQEMRSELIDFVRDSEVMCKHFHMPLQSGSNKILKLMNRNYRKERYLAIIDEIKSKVPECAITTDIIVGFPYETEEDFQETLDVVQIVEFDSSFSFVFSPRPGTKAASFDGKVPRDVALKRLYRLQALQKEITQRKLKNWIGKVTEVLVEGPSADGRENFVQGKNSQGIYVVFEAPGLVGQLVSVKITSAASHTLCGEIWSQPL